MKRITSLFLAVVLLVGLVFGVLPAGAFASEVDAASSSASGINTFELVITIVVFVAAAGAIGYVLYKKNH